MHRFAPATLVVFLFAVAAGNSSCCRKPVPPPSAPPARRPICFELRGEPRLQWFQGSPHSLYVRLFPLGAEDGFAAAQPDKLLTDPPPQIPGAAGTPASTTVYPGKSVRVDLEISTSDVKAVGIVGGYFEPKGQTKTLVPVLGKPASTCVTVVFGEAYLIGTETPGGGH